MKDNKLLYQLEYELAETRKKYLSHLNGKEITLKEVLDLGFNNTYINGVGIYKDDENEYVANGYYIKDDELLNAKIQYIKDETYTDYYGEYLEIYCKFVEEKYNEILKKIVSDENE